MRTIGKTMLLLLVSGLIAGCPRHEQHTQLRGGFQSLESHQYEEALRSADAYLAENPSGAGTAEALYLRGRALEQRVKKDEAESAANLRAARQAYEQALGASPAEPLRSYVLVSLGNVCYFQGEYEAAERHWTRALASIELEELKPWIQYRVGMCQQRAGKWLAADSTFAELQRQHPGTEAAQRAGAYQGARAFYVQVGAFSTPAAADTIVAKLRTQGFTAVHMQKTENKNLHLAMVGPLKNYEMAVAVRARLAGQYRDAVIVP